MAIVWRSVPVYCPGLLSRPYFCKCCTYTGFMAVGSLGFIEEVNTGVEHNFRSHTNRIVSKKCKTKRLRNVTWLDIELNSLVYQKSTRIIVLKTLSVEMDPAKCDINRKAFIKKRGAEIFGEIFQLLANKSSCWRDVCGASFKGAEHLLRLFLLICTVKTSKNSTALLETGFNFVHCAL